MAPVLLVGFHLSVQNSYNMIHPVIIINNVNVIIIQLYNIINDIIIHIYYFLINIIIIHFVIKMNLYCNELVNITILEKKKLIRRDQYVLCI